MNEDYLGNLTAKEREIAQFTAKGLSNSEIAALTSGSINTVKTHLKAVFRKVGVNSRAELANLLSSMEVSAVTLDIQGLWLSRFIYFGKSKLNGKPVEGTQFSLELVTRSQGDYLDYSSSNILGIGTRKEAFSYTTRCRLEDRFLVGIWQNRSTQNIGCFQLLLQNTNLAMIGMHLGNASDNSVQSGRWEWLKVESDKNLIPQISSAKYQLLPLEQLIPRFETAIEEGVSISFTKIIEK